MQIHLIQSLQYNSLGEIRCNEIPYANPANREDKKKTRLKVSIYKREIDLDKKGQNNKQNDKIEKMDKLKKLKKCAKLKKWTKLKKN